MTDCLDAPTQGYPREPDEPKPGDPITDVYVRALKSWGNRVLGIATEDRLDWRGERRCIRKLQAEGQVR